MTGWGGWGDTLMGRVGWGGWIDGWLGWFVG